MSEKGLRTVAASGLVVGAVLGMAGTFAPSASIRGLAWGLDGTGLVLATALLTVHHVRRGNEIVAAGYLIFFVGEALILSSAAMDLTASAPSFAAGISLWAAALAMISAAGAMPFTVRAIGSIAAVLFAVVALQMFAGRALTALSQPLPFFAYPFLAATLFAWAWTHAHDRAPSSESRR